MSRYKAYPEYKDSGVEWLGMVPSHWTTCRIKNTATVNPAKSEVREMAPDTEVAFIPMEAIGENGELDTSRTKPLSEVISGYSYVADGDIMIAKITPCFENGKGAVARNLANGIGFATTEVINVRPNNPKDSAYLLYLLSTNPFRKLAEGAMYGAGGQKRVADSFVAEYHFSLPELSERTKISAFLDHETAQIDALIEKQQRLIELLKEKRQAVISHAVTKGLNPNAPMKDSGVEWLGEVPAHWVISRIKNVTSRIVDGPHFSPSYVDDGYMFLSARNIKVDRWSLSDAKYISESDFLEFNKRIKPEQGDVLLTKGGTTGVARAVDLDFDFQIWVHVAVLKTIKEKIDCFFLAYVLNGKSCYEQSQLSTYGATNNDLGLSRIANIVFTLPPMEEQNAICAVINDKCRKIDELISKGVASIELMQERRTALISAAVTGKIDVRDWQPAAA